MGSRMSVDPQRAGTSVRRADRGRKWHDRSKPSGPWRRLRTLDQWRHLPFYRLEPTLAPFFGLFLPDILSGYSIIPEFPLQKKTLYEKGKCYHQKETYNNLSANVDYAAFRKDHAKAYLIELKTDHRSFREEQLNYLRCARKAGLCAVLDGILDICRTTDHKGKYIHLIHNLEKLGLIYIPDSGRNRLYEKTFPKGKSGWSEAFNCVSTAAIENLPSEIEIVYITPAGSIQMETMLQI